tara:strand:+ start:1871 stop:2080 length:210 start_codon:yes stop_codon:yes gene_type:complete
MGLTTKDIKGWLDLKFEYLEEDLSEEEVDQFEDNKRDLLEFIDDVDNEETTVSKLMQVVALVRDLTRKD